MVRAATMTESSCSVVRVVGEKDEEEDIVRNSKVKVVFVVGL